MRYRCSDSILSTDWDCTTDSHLIAQSSSQSSRLRTILSSALQSCMPQPILTICGLTWRHFWHTALTAPRRPVTGFCTSMVGTSYDVDETKPQSWLTDKMSTLSRRLRHSMSRHCRTRDELIYRATLTGQVSPWHSGQTCAHYHCQGSPFLCRS